MHLGTWTRTWPRNSHTTTKSKSNSSKRISNHNPSYDLHSQKLHSKPLENMNSHSVPLKASPLLTKPSPLFASSSLLSIANISGVIALKQSQWDSESQIRLLKRHSPQKNNVKQRWHWHLRDCPKRTSRKQQKDGSIYGFHQWHAYATCCRKQRDQQHYWERYWQWQWQPMHSQVVCPLQALPSKQTRQQMLALGKELRRLPWRVCCLPSQKGWWMKVHGANGNWDMATKKGWLI